MKSLLIANRGEIAVRIARAGAELGLRTIAVYAEDDAQSLHVRAADEALPLSGSGASAYLDMAQIIAEAKNRAGLAARHPRRRGRLRVRCRVPLLHPVPQVRQR